MRAPVAVIASSTQTKRYMATFCCAAFGARIIDLRPCAFRQSIRADSADVMEQCMFTAGKYLKVIQRVVRDITIDMMHNLVTAEFPSKVLFHDKAVEAGSPAAIGRNHLNVSKSIRRTLTLPARVIRTSVPYCETHTATELVRIAGIPNLKYVTAVHTDGSWGRIVGHRKLLSFGVTPGLFAQRPASCFPQVYQENGG